MESTTTATTAEEEKSTKQKENTLRCIDDEEWLLTQNILSIACRRVVVTTRKLHDFSFVSVYEKNIEIVKHESNIHNAKNIGETERHKKQTKKSRCPKMCVRRDILILHRIILYRL